MPRRKKPPEVPTPPGSHESFDLRDPNKTVIIIPLLKRMLQENDGSTPRIIHNVIIDLNHEYQGGLDGARAWTIENIHWAKEHVGQKALLPGTQGLDEAKNNLTNQYLFAALESRVIQELVGLDEQEAMSQIAYTASHRAIQGDTASYRAIRRIWPDFEVSALLNRSIATVKADVARRSFGATGEGIVWAVMDSGISPDHRHFAQHMNIKADRFHRDFTAPCNAGDPFIDYYGHGTHVAGIIAGEQVASDVLPPKAVLRSIDANGEVNFHSLHLEAISGIAPKCSLVSLKVLDANGKGTVSNLIAAIAYIQQINSDGRHLRIHGVNVSVGYNCEPEWFACGQSPICVEVDRLARSGVLVVVAAGNTGFGKNLTIYDPGNANLPITVGSTHRDDPSNYGVSLFSSRGPTGDGRVKPDLVAPGEQIISCAVGGLKKKGAGGMECDYIESSGTSIAAAHVSGAAAALLSVRKELRGRPEEVKKILMDTATDLHREPNAQGAGLVNLMAALNTEFIREQSPGLRAKQNVDSHVQPSNLLDEKLVFVISSFAENMDPSFKGIVAAARASGLVAKRVKDFEGDYKITDKIIELIRSARFIVVDLTHERPNVYFELGYARGLGKSVITIAREGTDVHFDVKDWKYQSYNDSRTLETYLKKRFKHELTAVRRYGI